MKFVADEGVDRQIIEAIRGAGHDVISIQELMTGSGDAAVLTLANSNEAILTTEDDYAVNTGLSKYVVATVRFTGAS